MPEATSSSDIKARRACISCKKQKRKCDKSLPTCGLCCRVGRHCDYSSESPPASNAADLIALQRRVQELETTRLSNDSASPKSWFSQDQSSYQQPYPALFFLDAWASVWLRRTFVKPHPSVPLDITEILETGIQLQKTLDCYFERSVHRWLPIISRVRLTQTLKPCLDGDTLVPSADLTALLLAINLVTVDEGSRDMYHRIKPYLSWLESQCVFSLPTIQAHVLVAVYEIANAIYPAAYLSVSHCIGLANATGMSNRRISPQLLPKETRWTEMEERRRVWWAIQILERYLNLANRSRPLMSREPPDDEPLPTEDASWDQGIKAPNDVIALSSDTDLQASPFARTCQAAYIVDKFLRHANDSSVEFSERFAAAIQLHKTLNALKALLTSSDSFDGLWTAIAFCYSALIALYDTYVCTESPSFSFMPGRGEMQMIAVKGLQTISAEVVQFSRKLRAEIELGALEGISPLVADCLYNAAATFVWYVRETAGDANCDRQYHELRETLEAMQSRWDVARVYLRELEAQELQ